MQTKQKRGLKIFLIVIMVLFGLWLLAFVVETFQRHELYKKSEQIIVKIEQYRLKNGKLPESLADIKVEEDKIFYHKSADSNYVVDFPDGSLGESTAYYSSEKKWNK